MNPVDAREHIEMVDRIVAASSRKLEAGGEFFVAWGLAGSATALILTLILDRRLPASAQWVSGALLLAALVFTILRARWYRKFGAGMSLIEREYLSILWIAISMAFITQIAGFNLFPVMAQMAMYNVVEAMVLLYIGLHGNRRAQICAAVLITSIVVANFFPPYAGYVLSAGVLFGYAAFGVAELLAHE